MFSKLFGLLFAVLIIVILPLLASTTYTTGKVEDTTFTGKLVCLGCELKKADAARAACNAYGHRFAMKLADGRFVKFLENIYSEDLINGKKLGDKEIVVHGKYYSEANLIDVRSFEADGQEFAWCRHCRDMDVCASKIEDTP